MAANSKIEWCDHTFNPWRGCTKVHEGCAHCYAERDSKRFPDIRGIWGPNGTRVVASANSWREPATWNRWAEEGVCPHCHGKSNKDTPGKCGRCNGTGNIGPYRARVFCASLADVFEEFTGHVLNHHGDRWISCPACGVMGQCSESETCPQCGRKDAHWVTLDDLRKELFGLIDRTPWLDWLLVTKRPENIRRMMMPWLRDRMGAGIESPDDAWKQGLPLKNVWLLTSVSNQETFGKQWPELAKCRDLAPVLGLSAEPLLGPIELRCPRDHNGDGDCDRHRHGCPRPDWIIVGGESGLGARPMHPDWARSLRDQCQAAGVAFFFKQGSQANWTDFKSFESLPMDLQIREFPNASK